MALKVIIVGSGIAGLTAAAVLRSTAEVTIIERGEEIQIAGGQGLGLGPNGTHILESLGFDRNRAHCLVCQGVKAYNAKTGLLEKTIPFNAKDTYGSEFFTGLRSDIRAEILRLATGGTENSPTVLKEARVTDVDTDSGKVVLDNGATLSADLVIIASGIHTDLKRKVVDNGNFKTEPTGQSIIRLLISKDNAIKEAGYTPEWWDPMLGGHLSNVWKDDGTNRAIIIYPCRDFEYINVSLAFSNEYLEANAGESWYVDGDINQALRIFKDFPDSFMRFVKYAEQVRVWGLRDHDPLPNYARGRAALIGDAAHAMAPFQGQGACQAIEDAEGFRLFAGPTVSRDDVPAILKKWESVRRPRASQLQLNTRRASKKLDQSRLLETQRFNWTYDGIYKELEKLYNKESQWTQILDGMNR